MKKSKLSGVYIITCLLLFVFIVYGYLNGLSFSSNSVFKSRMKEKNMLINEYKVASQDNYKFYLCHSDSKLVFLSMKRFMGLLWYINEESSRDLDNEVINFSIYSRGDSFSLLYGICHNSSIYELQLSSNNTKEYYEIDEAGLFIFKTGRNGIIWDKLEVLNYDNEIIWSSNESD